MSSPHATRTAATARDLRDLPAELAAEVIGGEVVRKAEPSAEHGSAQLALGGVLFTTFGSSRGGGTGGWWLMSEVEVEYEAHEVYRHDVVGWRRERTPARPSGRAIALRPDWVCEILSPSNAANDTVRKLRTLRRHAVPNYWLLDPERLTLTVLRWTSEGYLEALAAASPETVRAEPFEAIEIALSEVFGR